MNYNDEILENKAFNFFKQLMYNIALSICILLVGVLVMVYGFGLKLFEVLSNSQAPYFVKGDMVIVKAQDDYKIGDIIQFVQGANNVSHRLIATYQDGGKTIYVCHGDNNESANPNAGKDLVPWQEDSAYVQDLLDRYGTFSSIPASEKSPGNVQLVEKHQIGGKVVNHIDNVGSIVAFIKDHYLLVIALVAGVWCVSSVAQDEIELRKTRRLL